MKLAYFDCFAGAAGDMIVGALVNAGADAEALQAGLEALGDLSITVEFQTVRRGGIAGALFKVTPTEQPQPERHLQDILSLIDAAALPPRAADRARAIFTRLAQAEAKVHQVGVEDVHFHEVGAVDSIVDIVAAALALEQLGIEKVLCSPIAVGRGTVRCDHGLLPVPAPATTELLTGAPVRQIDVEGEATTPTAAAVLTTVSEGFGLLPDMKVESVGYGAGQRESGPVPNLLRVVVGRGVPEGQVDSAVELSANIDDSTGEMIGAAIEKLLASGCLDAWATPAVMKKSRPAWVVSVLCSPADAPAAEQILFEETTTLGIRRRTCTRNKLVRRCETVETPYGPIRLKIGMSGAHELTVSPEFSECLAAAQAHHVAVKEVVQAAIEVYRRGKG